MISVVVAHPDDEVLWCGGLIMRLHPEVVCCTVPERDPIRKGQFKDSCMVLGAGLSTIFDRRENYNSLLDLSDIYAAHPMIVSHGAAGEYGHPHHKAVHEHFMPQITFGFRGSGEFKLTLTQDERDIKRLALKCYAGKYPQYLDIFPDVFTEESYDASGEAGRKILAELCSAV